MTHNPDQKPENTLELLDCLTDNSNSNNFYRQIKFSPDELCFSATKNGPNKCLEIRNFYDNTISNFEKTPCININHGWTIYDHCFYPQFNSNNPDTCVVLTTSAGNGSKVRLFDAYSDGHLKQSYNIHCQYDEPTPTYSVEFSTCGRFVYTGRKNAVTYFDVNKGDVSDGTDLGVKPSHVPTKNIKNTPDLCNNLLSGIISTIKCHPKSYFITATGSFSGNLALLDARINKIPCQIKKAHPKGINCLKWRNEWQFLSGSRKNDMTIRLWDIRYPDKDNSALDFEVMDWKYSEIESKSLFMRNVPSHQKYEFDLLTPDLLITGMPKSQKNSNFRVFNLNSEQFIDYGTDYIIEPENKRKEHLQDNGFDTECTSFTSLCCSKFEPGRVLAVSGERPQVFIDSDSSSESEDSDSDKNENEETSIPSKKPKLDSTGSCMKYKVEKTVNSVSLLKFANLQI